MKLVDFMKDRFTLVMSLPQNDPALAKAAVEGGADVVKVHINVEHRASKTLFKSLKEEYVNLKEILKICEDRPCGIVVGGSIDYPEEDLSGVCEMGFDFISLYAHHARPEVLNFGNIAKMIAVDYTYDSQMISTLGGLGADVLEASVVRPGEYGLPLSMGDLMKYRAIIGSTSLPVIIPSQKCIKPSHAGRLREIGAGGVMIGAVVTGKSRDSIYESVREFRKNIDKA